jgi:4-aminobutyrate aminotransferase
MQKPKIVTSELPGPKAQKLIKKDRKYISPSYTRSYGAVIDHGKGMWLWDVDGNMFLDFNAGVAVCATGHCHPQVVKAIQDQAEELIHISGTDYYYPQQVKLAEKLAEIVPGAKNKRSFLTNSGAEAVETAFKLSRYKTKRPYVIAFLNSFHGRTMGALTLTGSKRIQKKGFGPLVPCVVHVPYGYCYRCFLNLEYPACKFACVKYIEDEIFRTVTPPEEVAAVFVEPIQGEGGYIVPPPGYLQELRQLCSKYGIFLVADEVQSGMGRTGKMFAIEHWETKADIYCLAKGIASGMPLGAAVAQASVMDWAPGAHANTFGGNPLACVAALATIKLLENGLVENAEKVGSLMLKRLEDMQNKYDFIGDTRGKGLMLGVELVEDPVSKKPLHDKRDGVIMECFRRGLILQGCGVSTVRFSPPLIVTPEEAQTALDIFERALKKVFRL